jgi:hypothetical protein
MNRKAYLIKGTRIEGEKRKSWIERVTISKAKAEEIKRDLNSHQIEEIEKGKEIFDQYIKEEQEEMLWDDKEFYTDQMSEEEFKYFCYYRYGTKLPFTIHEMDLS